MNKEHGLIWYRLDFSLAKNDGEHFDFDTYINPIKEKWVYNHFEKWHSGIDIYRQKPLILYPLTENRKFYEQSKWAKQIGLMQDNKIIKKYFNPVILDDNGNLVTIHIDENEGYGVKNENFSTCCVKIGE